MKQSHSWRLCIWTLSRAAAYKELKTLDWGKKKKKKNLSVREEEEEEKKKAVISFIVGFN